MEDDSSPARKGNSKPADQLPKHIYINTPFDAPDLFPQLAQEEDRLARIYSAIERTQQLVENLNSNSEPTEDTNTDEDGALRAKLYKEVSEILKGEKWLGNIAGWEATVTSDLLEVQVRLCSCDVAGICFRYAADTWDTTDKLKLVCELLENDLALSIPETLAGKRGLSVLHLRIRQALKKLGAELVSLIIPTTPETNYGSNLLKYELTIQCRSNGCPTIWKFVIPGGSCKNIKVLQNRLRDAILSGNVEQVYPFDQPIASSDTQEELEDIKDRLSDVKWDEVANRIHELVLNEKSIPNRLQLAAQLIGWKYGFDLGYMDDTAFQWCRDDGVKIPLIFRIDNLNSSKPFEFDNFISQMEKLLEPHSIKENKENKDSE